jgi:hypothetical protein
MRLVTQKEVLRCKEIHDRSKLNSSTKIEIDSNIPTGCVLVSLLAQVLYDH